MIRDVDTQPDDPSCHRFPVRDIVQEIIRSSRLTFEDETAVRHHLIVAKRRESTVPSWLRLVGAAAVSSLPFAVPYVAGSVFVGRQTLRQYPVHVAVSVGVGVLGISAKVGRFVLRKCVIAEVGRLMRLLQDTASLSKRISRWVQDNEVIQRGFVLMQTQPREDVNGASKVLSARACLRLRRAVFMESRFMVFVLRAAAVDLLQKIKRETQLDNTENHICLIPLEEFGESLSIPEDDLEPLYLATDGFSLQALKSLTGLLDLQVSEYAKLLCEVSIKGHDYLGEIDFLRRLREVHRLLLDAFNRMELEYKFETDEPLDPKARRSSAKNSFAPPDYWKSLELHLMAGLKSVRTLESENCTENELQKVMQQDMLEKLGYHVKCCSMLLDHLKRRSIVDDQSRETSEADVSPTKSDFELKDVVKADDDIGVQDEIFEAFILGDASGDYRGEPVRSEMNDYQEQKQQTKLVLEEIKTLLSVRSQEWKQRENRARERKGLPHAEEEDFGSSPSITETSADDFTSAILRPKLPETIGDYVTPVDVANIAAALSSQWRSGAEENFGYGDSESETEEPKAGE
ncbi:vezatin-like [Paramacrobiotus metropolitanus]|uniref:vezatin-like n=1 Tax=Paramacrobiotus metropolitanus TaxID=2943436 RepID=UPI0024464738|nr:vezatin-like [Paramacrobiotus metropolitanus]